VVAPWQAQVVPTYDHADLPAVKLDRECLNKYTSSTQPSFVSLDAFLNAMIIPEALKRTGPDLTREKFIAGHRHR
jgi:branched-chain amino acid transport system substrate-binding protein